MQKTIILLVTLFFAISITTVAIAGNLGDVNDNYSVSTLYIAMYNKEPFVLVIDDQQFAPNTDNVLIIEGLKPGKHLIKVLQNTPKGEVPRFYGTINVAPQKLIYAVIEANSKFNVLKELSTTTVSLPNTNTPDYYCTIENNNVMEMIQ